MFRNTLTGTRDGERIGYLCHETLEEVYLKKPGQAGGEGPLLFFGLFFLNVFNKILI